MKITRRDLMNYGFMGGVGVALPAGMFQVGRSRKSSPPVELFTIPLPIPPVARPVRSDGDTDFSEITQQEKAVAETTRRDDHKTSLLILLRSHNEPNAKAGWPRHGTRRR